MPPLPLTVVKVNLKSPMSINDPSSNVLALSPSKVNVAASTPDNIAISINPNINIETIIRF